MEQLGEHLEASQGQLITYLPSILGHLIFPYLPFSHAWLSSAFVKWRECTGYFCKKFSDEMPKKSALELDAIIILNKM